MKIVSNLNGTTKTTTYGDKLWYRTTRDGTYTQIKNAYYRESPNDEYTQVYLYDETPPTITVTSSLGVQTSTSYTIAGVISDTESCLASFTINGATYPITYGASSVNFSKTLSLSYGVNTVTLVATDIAGNSATTSVSIRIKNTSVITWSDTLTCTLDIDDGTGHSANRTNTSGPTYTGTRTSAPSSAYGWVSNWNEYRDDKGALLSSYSRTGVHISGLIPTNCNSISVSGSRDGNRNTYPLDWGYFGGAIYHMNGTRVLNFSGSINVSAYNNGAYYFRFDVNSVSYADGPSSSASLSISLNT